eukprot:scaffold20417_cov106-Isochrysis_galbana.AAC.2
MLLTSHTVGLSLTARGLGLGLGLGGTTMAVPLSCHGVRTAPLGVSKAAPPSAEARQPPAL